MVRLYYWFRHAPENRPGGPWWYRDFTSDDERELFIDDLIPLVKAYCKVDSDLPVHDDLMKIQPPQSWPVMRRPFESRV